jgi:hypothetical protein
MQVIVATGDPQLLKKAQNSLQVTMLYSMTTLRYFKAVAKLFS